MGMAVSFQRVWRWERSAHPDLAKCSDSSAPHVELLFGMSWILSLYQNTDWGQGVSKDPGDSAWLLYTVFRAEQNFFIFLNDRLFCCQAASLPDLIQLILFLHSFFFLPPCWLGLKSWNCPSCCHPQFLLPTPVPKQAVSGQSEKSTAAALNPLPVLSHLLLPSACWLSTHYLYHFPHFAFFLIFIFSERPNQKTSKMMSICVDTFCVWGET